jgi:pimeloyl-ACP methyl ester carboxylesterase
MTYQFAEVNGTKVHYEARGAGTAVSTSSGQAIVLIHAGVVNLGMWDDQMDAFAQQHRVIRYDIRGWGETANPPMTYSDHEDLYGLLNHLGIAQAALVGCSAGGKIALDFALTYPEMVTALVLVGSGLGGYEFTMEGMIERAEAMRAAYERGELDQAAEISTTVWYDGLGRRPDQVNRQGRARITDLIHHTFSLPEDEGERQELTTPAAERLHDIKVKTLVIVGDQDAPDIHRIAHLLQEGLPSAHFVKMKDTAHFPNVEKPAEFNQITLNFLSETKIRG